MANGMISYAQNGEDVILWRVFGTRAGAGFYVDVGAAHPVAHSVTKWFSQVGWSGINIEPVSELFQALEKDRPGDINLHVACGARSGSVQISVANFEKWGQSTIDPQTADHLNAAGLVDRKRDVEMVTLAAVLDQHAAGRQIDFLKVDVEGLEDQVLTGAALDRHRPRIVVVEAVEPDSGRPNHERWEHIVTEQGYVCALFDGLNRFYCLATDSEARERMALGVFCMDEYTTHREYVLRMALENLALLVAATQEDLETVAVLSTGGLS